MEQLTVLIVMVGGFILVAKVLGAWWRSTDAYEKERDLFEEAYTWELDHAPNQHPDSLKTQRIKPPKPKGRWKWDDPKGLWVVDDAPPHIHSANIGGRWNSVNKTWVYGSGADRKCGRWDADKKMWVFEDKDGV